MLDPLHDLPALALGHPPYRRPLRDVSCAEHGAPTKPIAAAAMPLRQGHVARAPSLSAPPRPRLCAPGHPSPQCNAVRRAASAAPAPSEPWPAASRRERPVCAIFSSRVGHGRKAPRQMPDSLGAACVLASCQPRRLERAGPFDTSAVLAWDRSRLGPPVAASSRLCVLPLTQWPWPQVWGASWGTDTYVDRWRPHRRYSTSELCCLSPPLPLEHLFLIVLLPHCRFRRRSPPFPTPPPPSPPSVTTW